MQIKITLDGKAIEAEAGKTILEVARNQGILIPHMCHDEKLEPFGSCWVCLVEVKGARGFVPACATRVADGMVVDTDTERTRAARRMALELLLSNHFGDCIGPCQNTCPAGCDAQGYLALAANGMVEEAIRLIKETLPLPASLGRVCPHPCETECRRNLVDEPVAICAIKRYLADVDLASSQPFQPAVAKNSGKKVAVVGAGPAGLTAAYYLRQRGHAITIFEALPKAGGWLRYGIPQYRLPKEILDREIATITNLGIEIRTNVRLGKDIRLSQLQQEYDAIFLGCGAHLSVKMGVGGEELPEVLSGIDFLKRVALGENFSLGRSVAVVGGGNTAIDAARTAFRLGVDDVTIYYRRTEKEMPANQAEIEEARKEGVKFEFLVAPIEVQTCTLDRQGGMICQQMELGEPDASGRRRPIPKEGSDFPISADTIISAIGQKPDLLYIEASGLKITRWSTLEADAETGVTSLPGVFAAGDLVSGPATVVEAIGGAHKAALAIDSFLRTGLVLRQKPPFNVFKGAALTELSPSLYADRPRQPRAQMPTLPAFERRNFAEVDLGFPPDKTEAEALRCLECGCADVVECRLRTYSQQYEVMAQRFLGEVQQHPIDDSHPFIQRDPNKCILCGRCIRICLEVVGVAALGFVYRGFNTIMAPTMQQPYAESTCVSCGACIETCPVGALTEKTRHLRQPHLNSKTVPVVCTYCGVGCSLQLHTEGGKVVKVTGNAESPVNAGALCFKGKFGYEFIHDPGRLVRPLVRKNGCLTECSWEEAFDFAQDRMRSLIGSSGPDAVAFFASGRSTCEEAMALRHWATKLGGNRFASMQYAGSGQPLMAFAQIVGKSTGQGYERLDSAETILLVGSDLPQEHPVLAQRLNKAALRGAMIYSLQTHPTRIAHWAQREWIVKHGGLSWALNGAIKSLLLQGAGSPLDGFAELKTALKLTQKTLWDMSDLKPTQIAELTRTLQQQNLVIVFHADVVDRETAKALGNLLLLLGRPDSFIALRDKANIRGVDRFLNVQADEVLTAMEEGKVRGAFLLNEDPLGASAEAPRVLHALAHLDTLIVADLFLTETALMAHLVLPSSSFAESSGTFINSEGRVQRFAAAILPVSGLATIDIFVELAGEPLFEIPATRSYRQRFAAPTLVPAARSLPAYFCDIVERRAVELKKSLNLERT
ncbi:MAG: molybdopterin-dependent oxidoreductase [bacterium]